jgi:predicted Rossmann fold nucleotide-binding protein DprA/Smf involved in DNA uptake
MQQHSVDIDKWLKLIRADGVGPTTFARLLKHFGSVDRVLDTQQVRYDRRA